MKKILFIGSLVMASLLYAQGSQPVEITQQDINTQNEMSDASTKDITPKSIEDFFEEFADNFCRRKNKISIWKNKTSIKVEILFFYKP